MWYNSMMKWLLRSPLHGVISKNIMLITYTGRKSGKLYTIPVNYVRKADHLSVVSYRDRTWWRNLRGGAPVTLLIEGQDHTGCANVSQDDDGMAQKLTAFLQQVPHYAKYFNVALEPNGEPNYADIVKAAASRVMVGIELT